MGGFGFKFGPTLSSRRPAGQSFDVIVIEGDSLTSTTPSTYSSGFYSYQYDDYKTTKTIEVRAQASRVVATGTTLNDNGNSLLGNIAEDVAYGPDLITYMIGANDMAAARTAAQYKADLVTVYNAYKAADPAVKIAWSPPLPYNSDESHANYANFTAQRTTLLVDDRDPAVWGTFADYYFPMGRHPDFIGNTSLYSDSVHVTNAGQLLLYAIYRPAIDTILDSSRTNATTPSASVWPASQTNLATSTVITDRFVVEGIKHTGLALSGANSLAVSGSGAQLRVNGGTYGASASGWLYNGDVIDVKVTTSASNDTPVSYDLTIGTETRTITKRTVVAATPITYTAGVDTLTSTASAVEQIYSNVTFAAGIPVVVLTSHSNAGGTNDSTPTAGNVTLVPSGGGATITLVMRKRQDRAVSRTHSFWSGSATIAAGDYTLTVTRPLAASHNAVQYWTIHDADPTPTATDGNVPAEPSNANHSTPSITVNASGMAFAAYLIEDDTTPDAVTISAGATEFQAEVVAINTSGIGLAVAARSTTGAVEFNHKAGTFARLIVAFKALGT